MFRLWIYIVILSFFMMIGAVFANEVISKDPNYIKNRGSGFEVVHIANYKKSELKNHNYSIIKDPTGKFKMIESISPRKGDCGTAGHFYKANKVKIGTGTTDCNSNRLRLEVAMDKNIRTGKKDKNVWVSYYIYIPDTKDNFNDKFLQPYITQFYGTDRGKTGQNRGGYGPQYSASIYNGKLTMDGMTLVDKEISDFSQSALLLNSMDKVITVDTSLIHLAGTLNKKSLLLLPKIPDWRWGLKGNTSMWYPSVRIARQQNLNDWNFIGQKVDKFLFEN